MSSPGSIFISYRRSDSIAETGRIYDRLEMEFGRDHVFKDVDSIPFGVDFAEYLDQAVGQCQVVLVIIGKTWLTVAETDGSRRLDNPDDFVRIEVESALARGIPVIPVLLEGVKMPRRPQLPRSLHPLARRNGIEIGYDPRFRADMNRLVKGIKDLLRATEGAPAPVAEALAEEPAAPVSSSPTFSFEVVQVNPQGQIQHRERKTAEYFRDDLGNGVTLDMVRIPSGSFLMGSPEDELERSSYEGPQHQVTVSQFFMGRYPITQAQWQAVASLPQVERELDPDPSRFKGANRPVEQVSWEDAVEFCNRLSRYTGKPYRLPSEAEWEYACRAGTQTPFYFGKTLTTEVANYDGDDTYGDGPKGEYRKETTPVDHFGIANAFGLSDMHGNVFEWCQDPWHENYKGAPTDGSAWLFSDESEKKPVVVRGGSWDVNPWYCRSAYRIRVARDYFTFDLGFRVCCASPRTL